MKKKNQGASPRNSCGGKGCYISVYQLPYGHRVRRKRNINRAIKAKV